MNRTGKSDAEQKKQQQNRKIRSRTEKDKQNMTRREGQGNPSRTGQDEQDRIMRRTGQDADQDRTGQAQVSRCDDLDLDLVAFFELKANQSGSGFKWTKDSKNIGTKVDRA
jgi:hypothetical protein